MERKWLANWVQREEMEGEGSLMDKMVGNGESILCLVESLSKMEKFLANLLARKDKKSRRGEQNIT